MLALNIAVGGTIVFTLLAVFAQAAAGRADRPADRPGPGREPAPQRAAAPDRRAAEGRAPDDRRPVHARRPSSSPTWSTSRRAPSGCHPPRSSASSTISSAISTCWPSGTGSRRSRPSATPTWSPRASRHRGRTMPARWRCMALDMVDAMRSHRRGAAPRPGTAGRDQFRPRGRGRHRPEALPLRPVGRRRQHRQPHGIAGHAGPDPDHPRDPRSDRGRVRVRAAEGRSRSRARARWRPGTCSSAGRQRPWGLPAARWYPPWRPAREARPGSWSARRIAYPLVRLDVPPCAPGEDARATPASQELRYP